MEELDLEESNIIKEKTPKWLRRLERESWQAELLISGVALIGCLQLPKLVYLLADYFLIHLPPSQSHAGYAISFLNLLAICVLTTFFILHFILRAYWIGLIGLNSVYPKGYKIEEGFYSPIYARQWIKILPSVKSTIKKVDDMASTQFAGAFSILLMYGMMAVTSLVVLILYSLLDDYLPTFIFIIGLVLIALFFVSLSILQILAMNKKNRFNDRIQNAYFKAARYFSMFSVSFLYKPINQIMFTFASNAKSSKNFLTLIPLIIVASNLTTFHMNKSNIPILIDQGNLGKLVFPENRINNNFYLDQFTENSIIYTAVVPSEIHKDDFLKVFIPVLKNESFLIDNFCQKYQKDSSVNFKENRSIREKYNNECRLKYHKIYVNDILYTGKLYIHTQEPYGQFGLMAYVSNDHFNVGENKIKTQKLLNKEGEIYKEFEFPVFYAGNKK